MKLIDFLKNNIVILDGGMGTLLQSAGLRPGDSPELWSITHPDTIQKIHRDYYDSGSNVVNTNTFGANSLKLSDSELEAVISTSIENAMLAREQSVGSQEKYISLDIGPLGRLLKPFGDFDFKEAVEVFAKTVRLGVKYGADLITVETMNDSYETKAAVLAVKENSDFPVFVSNAYSANGKLMTGASPEAMVAMLEGLGVTALGANCSLGPKQLSGVVGTLLERASLPVILKPNAGLPQIIDGKTVFEISLEEFGDDILNAVNNGVRIVGGCCGTDPSYIKCISEKLNGLKPCPIVEKEITCVSSYTHAVDFGTQPILIGERINPTGKKRFKEALVENDIGYILNEGLAQQEKGVHILDVNVGLPEIDEARLLTASVTELQAIIDLPLQIDTSDPYAMEHALRVYNGKPLINSVSGKEESMNAIFPLAKKYGGTLIALTLDESGIPSTADGRLEIARKILARAETYGIAKKDIIFDTLAMTVSADSSSPSTTLSALRAVKNELGCHTSLGVSNISFGLPSRDAINSVFFAMALENGLSAAIMNPYSVEMMKVYYSYRALHALDTNCEQYIAFASSLAPTQAVTKLEKKPEGFASELQKAIIKGLREQSAALTVELIKEEEPMSVIKNEIIPALDTVGSGYEKGEIYLPQLLMSAEAAGSAFEVIRARFGGTRTSESKGKIVIATVKGDIHDIGKNIVRLLLENYGYTVIDLGKDVSPEEIAEAVVQSDAPLVGLSALMTTTVPAMEETVRLLKQKAPWCKTVVGGAVLTKEYADKMGADKYAADAMETVRYAEEIM